jgi:DNA mismatch repair ATPase MutS
MPIPSVLYPSNSDYPVEESLAIPDFFTDINLDQIVDAITDRKQDYNLLPFFYAPLRRIEEIKFRQDIFKDMENESVLKAIKAFAEKIALVRRYLNMIEKLYFKYHQEGWFLEAGVTYCEAVQGLVSDLQAAPIRSKGLVDLLDYIREYIVSPGFLILQSESLKRKAELSSIQYNVIIKGNWVRVRKYESEIDYSKEVEQTFEKFKQGEVKNYRIDLLIASGMNHVEAQIVDCVAKLFPDIFKRLSLYCQNHTNFIDKVILTFDRQIQFYVAYIDFIEDLKSKGLKFCYPIITKDKAIHAKETFDFALAKKLISESEPVVCNDFYLKGKERIFVVSGPNQGGKTTFARMFGQLHYLASLGCPIPGKEATLYHFDQIFTHFEKEEDIRNLRGKLQDDLVRIHKILESATSESIIIMNEIFTSTTLMDAIFLSKEIIQRIIRLDALAVCVTFIDELSTMGEQTVSMVSTVVPENPTQRTFKIVRMPADGLSYAICIAEKYHLTYESIKERILQ